MVRQEMDRSSHIPFEKLEKTLEEMQEGEMLDLFGGEPTLYPHFWELLERVAEKKLRATLATNCRSMASLEFVNRLNTFPKLQIRTSLYGHTAKIHDYYTRVRGSYDQTIQGIKNLCDAGNPPRVNTVMLEKNCEHLWKIVDVLWGLGVKSVKFSSVFGGDFIEPFLIDYNEVKPHLNKALKRTGQKDMAVQVEKSPYCLAPEFINHFLPESDPATIASYRLSHLYAEDCQSCKMKRACCGVLRPYYEKFKASGLSAFDSVPNSALRAVPFSGLEAFRPRHESEFISIEYTESESRAQNILSTLRNINNVKKRFPHVYIVNNGAISM
jgi:MoaA/NifB/PqqE/SkfB family radical SAM enzyme